MIFYKKKWYRKLISGIGQLKYDWVKRMQSIHLLREWFLRSMDESRRRIIRIILTIKINLMMLITVSYLFWKCLFFPGSDLSKRWLIDHLMASATPRQTDQYHGHGTDDDVSKPVCANHYSGKRKNHKNNKAISQQLAEITPHECRKNKQHHTVIAGKAISWGIFVGTESQLLTRLILVKVNVGLARFTGINAWPSWFNTTAVNSMTRPIITIRRLPGAFSFSQKLSINIPIASSEQPSKARLLVNATSHKKALLSTSFWLKK